MSTSTKRVDRAARRIVALLMAVGAVACSDTIPPSDVAAPPPITTVTIGPEGGRFELPSTNLLGVVQVDIPAGALSEPTEITIAPGLHDAPLPERAFPVGPYVRFEPKGLTLAVAAKVTLPVYDEIRDSFGQDAKFVKVWLKGPEKWELYEQVGGGAGYVTIETDRLDVAGAGVKMPTAGGTNVECVLSGACALPTPSVEAVDNTTCSSGGGYCVANLGSIARVPLVPRLFGGPGYVAWVDLTGVEAEGTLTAMRISDGGTIVDDAWPALDVGLDVFQDALRDRGAALVGDALTLGTLGGLAAFEPGSAAFAAAEFPTLAVTAAGDGRLVHFVTRTGRVAAALSDSDGGWGDFRTLSGVSPGGALLAATAGTAVLALAMGDQLLVADAQAATVALRPDAATLDGSAVAIAAMNGEVAVVTDAGRLYRAEVSDGGLDVDAVGVDEVHALTSDGLNFWVALNNRPAIARLTGSGLVDVVALGQPEEGSEEADNLVPRAIASPAPGVVIVLTRAGEFIRVRVAVP